MLREEEFFMREYAFIPLIALWISMCMGSVNTLWDALQTFAENTAVSSNASFPN